VTEQRPVVFMPCCGLGRITRGFESAALETHNALRNHGAVDPRLFSGGPVPGATRIPSPDRHSRAARVLGRLMRGRPGYSAEQAVFAVGLLPHIAAQRPEVVYVSDIALGQNLNRLRRAFRLRFALVLCNGGVAPPPYTAFDHVQQVAPHHLEDAVAAGVPPERQTLLPTGLELPGRVRLPGAEERAALRRALDLPADRPVLVSVAALTHPQKRVDYLVEEVSRLDGPRPFLLMLGAPEADTPQILALARARLGKSGFSARTVPREEVAPHLRAADAFVHSSMLEGFSVAVVEAAAQGLPCLVHDSPTFHYPLGEHGEYADLTRAGALAARIPALLRSAGDTEARARRAAEMARRFSWRALAPGYADMLLRAAARMGR
jgi:glycosyltransferase involved in cell wall biosynthesis